MAHKKFGLDRFSRFDVYWTQTNKQTPKQTDRQAKFIYSYGSLTLPPQRFEPRVFVCGVASFLNARSRYPMWAL